MKLAKLMRLILAFFLGLLLVLILVVYVTIIHPNDKRLEQHTVTELLVKAKTETSYELAGSIFRSKLIHDIGPEPLSDTDRERLKYLSADLAEFHSARFLSPHQAYVSFGTYPYRLEAWDGFYVPIGRWLEVQLPDADVELVEFSAIGVGEEGSKVAVKVDSVSGVDDQQLGAVTELKSWNNNSRSKRDLFDQWSQVWTVERRASLPSWLQIQVPWIGRPQSKIKIRCDHIANQLLASSGCFFSDVSFLRKKKSSSNNLIVFVVDTMRADALASKHTPTFRKFADSNVNFTNATAPGNMTSPSTNALLACRRPSTFPSIAFSYGIDRALREEFYTKKISAWPEQFWRDGYKTSMIGNVSVLSEVYGGGVNHGFESQVAIEVEAYDTPQIADEVIRWLSENRHRKFFLYVHFNGPHAPYRAPLSDLFTTFPGFSVFSSYARVLRWLYEGELVYTDRHLNRVFDAIHQLNLDDETKIVLTADHGDQHALRSFSGNYAGEDFRGSYFDHGATLYQDEVHVPLILKNFAPVLKERKGDYVSTLALGPTVLQDFGLPPLPTCELAPLQDASTKVATFGSEAYQGRAIIFDGRFKYIRTYVPTDKRIYDEMGFGARKIAFMIPEQLFDLQTDPQETVNLFDESTELSQKARHEYRVYYDVKRAYELIVESPEGQTIFVTMQGMSPLSVVEGQAKITQLDGKTTVNAYSSKLLVIRLQGEDFHSEKIVIGGKEYPLLLTSFRLSANLQKNKLPLESAGIDSLLPRRPFPNAYLRAIEDHGHYQSRLSSGNARFEKVLRDWGYLDD